jgi:hypothetical protein
MRLSLTALVLSMFLLPSVGLATVFTVCNTPGSIAQYADAQAAIDAAEAGDTIYLMASSYGPPQHYGTLSINKQLTVIGAGTWLAEDAPQNGPYARVQWIDLGEFSGGSTFLGLRIASAIRTINVAVANITIRHCIVNRVDGSTGYSQYRWTIANSILDNSSSGPVNIGCARECVITNCIIRSPYNISLGDFIGACGHPSADNVFTNNIVFKLGENYMNPLENVRVAEISGNIIHGGSDDVDNGQLILSSNVTHNLFFGAYSEAGLIGPSSTASDNIYGADPLFTETTVMTTPGPYPWVTNLNPPYADLDLQTGSPALGSGIGGADMGIYTGSHPWLDSPASPGRRYHPEPRIPQVDGLMAPSTVQANSSFDAALQARNTTLAPVENLSSGEYFFDADPGHGNGTLFSFTAADDIDITVDVSTSGLTVGTHRLGIRVMRADGTWSHFVERDIEVVECASLNLASSITETACGSYEAPDGQVYTESGDYVAVISGTAGCDSTISIGLIIVDFEVEAVFEDGLVSTELIAETYQWLDCNNGFSPLPGEFNQTFTPSANGSYAVEVSIEGCSATSECLEVLITGITDARQQRLSISPNPTTGQFTIDLGTDASDAVMELYDMQGRRIATQHASGQQRVQMEVDGPAGVYLLRVSVAGGTSQHRLVRL